MDRTPNDSDIRKHKSSSPKGEGPMRETGADIPVHGRHDRKTVRQQNTPFTGTKLFSLFLAFLYNTT